MSTIGGIVFRLEHTEVVAVTEEVGTGHVKLSINWPGMHSRHVTTK